MKQLVNPEYKIRTIAKFSADSKAASTVKWADRPTELVQDQVVETDVLLLPRVSSERRKYLPIGFEKFPVIGSDQVFQVENGTLYLFALLESSMHMVWLKTVGGRLKGDFRYSNTLVYNTFTIPKLNKTLIDELNKSGENILKIRKKLSTNGETLSDLYDPLLMPQELRKAHELNDKLVERIYGLDSPSDEERFSKLVKLYHKENE